MVVLEVKRLTKKIFFDTDCISAFLWINDTSIIESLYSDYEVYIPNKVYEELDKPVISHLKTRIDTLIERGVVKTIDMEVGTDTYQTFVELTMSPPNGQPIIGNGEAAAIAHAKDTDGILASNNIKDIKYYIELYKLNHTTTADILVSAYNSGLITEEQGNMIWANMLSKRRKLGASSFSDYLNKE